MDPVAEIHSHCPEQDNRSRCLWDPTLLQALHGPKYCRHPNRAEIPV